MGGPFVGRHRLDMIVGERAIVELKAASAIIPIHLAQMRSHLHATGCPIGVVINLGAVQLQWETVLPA